MRQFDINLVSPRNDLTPGRNPKKERESPKNKFQKRDHFTTASLLATFVTFHPGSKVPDCWTQISENSSLARWLYEVEEKKFFN